jgi:thiosulfate reductase cytochrome b subunit
MPGPLTRKTLRLGHMVEGTLLVAFVYTPLGDWGPARLLVRVVVVPAIIATGLLMWKLPALRARARRRPAHA